MLRNTLLASIIAVCSLTIACSGTGGSSGRSSTDTPEARKSTPSGTDSRVMMYQSKNDVLMIFVNESHSWRKSRDGRLAIALQDGSRSYFVISDDEMDALIQSIDARGYSTKATPFVQGDEQFISTRARDIPRYQGIVYVERGNSKTKMLGYRPNGQNDVAGQRDLMLFTEVKGVVQAIAMRNQRSEFPDGGVALPAKGGN